MKKWLFGLTVVVALSATLFVPVSGAVVSQRGTAKGGPSMDLSMFSADPPREPLRLLFIHHSCGGQLLAPEGPDRGDNCIYESHPNGGGLRDLLAQNHYEVHEVSYGSELGENTDSFDWLPKFKNKMDKVLSASRQDESYGDGKKNRVILFKSCFPNSKFVGEGSAPGKAAGPNLTVWNAKASLTAVLGELQKHPEVLYVYLTAPPLAPKPGRQPAWKWLAKAALGKGDARVLASSSELARSFNDWVKSPEGWLGGYAGHNVVVFDYFDVLTRGGASNLSAYPSGQGDDSHPSAEGNQRAARELVPLLNRAVHRAELAP